MKQDARRKRTEPPPPGTTTDSKPGRKRCGIDARHAFSRNPEDQHSSRRHFPFFQKFRGSADSRVGRGKFTRADAKSYKFVHTRTTRIPLVTLVLTCLRGLDSRKRRTVSRRCLSAAQTYKPPSRLSSAAWCCVSLQPEKPRKDKSCNDSEGGGEGRGGWKLRVKRSRNVYIYVYLFRGRAAAAAAAGKDKISNKILVKFLGTI